MLPLQPTRPLGGSVLIATSLLGLIALMVWAPPAAAGTITVQYEIKGGHDGYDNPISVTGYWTVVFTATGSNTIASGPATLLTLSADISIPAVTAVIGVPGTHYQSVHGRHTGRVTAKTYPTLLMRRSHIAAFRTPGPIPYALLQHHYDLSTRGANPQHTPLSGVTYIPSTIWHFQTNGPINTFYGQEISSTYIPEPGTLSLLTSGLILAAVVTGKRRLRRS